MPQLQYRSRGLGGLSGHREIPSVGISERESLENHPILRYHTTLKEFGETCWETIVGWESPSGGPKVVDLCGEDSRWTFSTEEVSGDSLREIFDGAFRRKRRWGASKVQLMSYGKVVVCRVGLGVVPSAKGRKRVVLCRVLWARTLAGPSLPS